MSEGAQKAFIGILAAVSGAALGTGVTYAIMKHNKKSNNDQQNCVTIKLPLGESPNGSSSNPENGADSRNLVSQLLSNLSPENRAAISNTEEGAAILRALGVKI